MEEARDRFYEKVNKTANCWLWTGSCNIYGYGRFNYNGKKAYAHRFAYELEEGPIPAGLVMRHKCVGTRNCVNPAHLETGTHKENMLDKIRDGTLAKGEEHGSAKLTQAQVDEIRGSDEKQAVLALRYGVNQSTISDIKNNKIWR